MATSLLQNRDYIFVLAKGANDNSPPQPGLQEQWQIAQNSIITLAHKSEEYDSDGITLYIASNPLQKYSNVTSAMLAEILQVEYSVEQVDLLTALQAAIHDYFHRKAEGKTKLNGEIITVVLDKEPQKCISIARLIRETTEKLNDPEELRLLFAQVGNDSITRGFLQALDDDLQKLGAKFDIADTFFLEEITDEDCEALFLQAIHG